MKNIVHISCARYRDVRQQVLYVSSLAKPGFLGNLQCRRSRFDSRVRNIPWRRDRFPTPAFMGFPGGSNGKESTCNSGELGLIPGLGKIAWRRAWQPTPVFLPEESHGQRSLVGYSPWTHKESDTTERLRTTRKASGRTVNCNTLNLLL